MLMKEDVEAIYGNGVYTVCIGKEIVMMLGLLEDSTGKKDLDSSDGLRQKTFVDVLWNDSSQEEITKKQGEDFVPLKPIANLKVVRGNASLELYIHEYKKG